MFVRVYLKVWFLVYIRVAVPVDTLLDANTRHDPYYFGVPQTMADDKATDIAMRNKSRVVDNEDGRSMMNTCGGPGKAEI